MSLFRRAPAQIDPVDPVEPTDPVDPVPEELETLPYCKPNVNAM